jgi:hypothetical protein
MRLVRTVSVVLLGALSFIAFYYSLFWGWASGTGTHDNLALKRASNIALAVSFVSFWGAIAVWFFMRSLMRRKAAAELGSQAAR